MTRRIAGIVVVVVALAAPSIAQDRAAWTPSPAVGFGPLFMRAQSPLTILRLSPTPMVPATLAHGQWSAGLLTDWANYFDNGLPDYIIDAESLRLVTGIGYGLSDRVEVFTMIPVAYRGGGVLDGFIERFESLVHGVNEDRRHAPRDRYLVLVNGRDGTYELSGRDAGWGLEDTVVGTRVQVARGTETTPAVVAGMSVKLPTGRQGALYSSGGVDVGLTLAVSQRLSRRLFIYGELAGTRYNKTRLAGVDLTRTQYTAFAALEWARWSRTSFLVQTIVTSRGARDFGAFSKPTYEVSLGFKHALGADLMLEAAVTENVLVYSNSEDVAFHTGVIWRSRPPSSIR